MNGAAVRPRVRIEGVGVDFWLYHHHGRSLWDWLIGLRAKSGGTFASTGYAVTGLRSVSVSVDPGDRLAVVGANGSGKTTLALVMAGILRPTRGTAETRGIVCAIIGGGEGPHPDATIADTARYEAIRQERTAQDAQRWAAEAIAFAEISRPVDAPMRTLSRDESGRICLALGLLAGANVFILDEAVSSFKPPFREKIAATFAAVDRNETILVVCERDAQLTAGLCRETVRLRDGEASVQTPIS